MYNNIYLDVPVSCFLRCTWLCSCTKVYIIYLHKLLVPLYVTAIVLHVYMFDIYYIDACNK